MKALPATSIHQISKRSCRSPFCCGVFAKLSFPCTRRDHFIIEPIVRLCTGRLPSSRKPHNIRFSTKEDVAWFLSLELQFAPSSTKASAPHTVGRTGRFSCACSVVGPSIHRSCHWDLRSCFQDTTSSAMQETWWRNWNLSLVNPKSTRQPRMLHLSLKPLKRT